MQCIGMKTNTMRRDTLLKLAKAGRLVAVSGYSFDDMTGTSRFEGRKPVNVLPSSGPRDHKEGYYNVGDWDFNGNWGRAYVNTNGSVMLYVHSNCNHTFVILTEKEVQEAKERLFIGVYTTGLSYSDKGVEEHGDYKKLGYFNYASLKLDIEKDCPPQMAALILDDANRMQKQAGQLFNTSSIGNPVLLGSGIHYLARDKDQAWLEAMKKPVAA